MRVFGHGGFGIDPDVVEHLAHALFGVGLEGGSLPPHLEPPRQGEERHGEHQGEPDHRGHRDEHCGRSDHHEPADHEQVPQRAETVAVTVGGDGAEHVTEHADEERHHADANAEPDEPLLPPAHHRGDELFPQTGREAATESFDPANRERLGHDLGDRAARIQRRDRILEDHLEATASVSQFLGVETCHVDAVEHHPTRGRGGNPHDRLAGGGFATTRLADDAHGLAWQQIDADIADGVDLGAGVPDRELDDHVLDPQHGIVGHISQVRCTGTGHQIPLSRISVISRTLSPR